MTRTFLALALLATPAVASAVPAQLTTQGRVLDADEAPLDGDVDVTFRLMDSESGGSTLWEETQSVGFTNGFYTVMLGADEAANPLEDSVLDQWPLYLEVQLDGEPAMVPRMAVGSVPYARQAGVAEELVAGADIDAGSLTVNGTEVVTADGEWAGATPDVDWGDLTGVPSDFADEDDADTLADLVCSDGQWAVWDGDSTAWTCDGFSDTTLLDADVVVAVGTDVVDLYADSTMDGYTILTEDSELAWAKLTGVPSGLDDGDDDTLATLSCTEGQIAVYDTGAVAWVCGNDTDNTLTPTEVVDAVQAAAALALPDATTVGGDAVITTTDTVAWSQLSPVPTGLSDGDDDTLGALSCSGSAIPVYSGTAWTCGTDTDNTLTATEVVDAVNAAAAVAMTGTLSVGGYAVLTEDSSVDWAKLTGVPTGLADGDDDTLAGLSCSDGEVATYDSSTGWGCGSASTSTGTFTPFLSRNSGGTVRVRRTDGYYSNPSSPSTVYGLPPVTPAEPTSMVGDTVVMDDGTAYRIEQGLPEQLAGSDWVYLSRNRGYVIDSTGAVYTGLGTLASTLTASTLFTGTGWDAAFIDGGESTTYAACGVSSGSISCYDNHYSGAYVLPTPPSSSTFVDVVAIPGCYQTTPTGRSDAYNCWGAVCAFTASGTFACNEQTSSTTLAYPTGTYTKAAFYLEYTSSTAYITICGLDSSGDVECEENKFSSSYSVGSWSSQSTSVSGYGLIDFALFDYFGGYGMLPNGEVLWLRP